MSATVNFQAIQIANQIISLSATALNLYQQVQILDAAWTQNSIATTLNSMATTALNADGTPGAADSVPLSSHPINTTLYPALNNMVTANQLTAAKTILDAILSLLNGNAVSAQGGAQGILNQIIAR